MSRIQKKVLHYVVFLILIGAVYATNKTTLDEKDDISVFEVNDNLVENDVDKSKRELPKEKFQSKLIDVLKPVPVVDTIREEEKYGNTGEKFGRIGRAVVSGVEAFANVINSALSFPMEAVKKLSRSATEALNNLGGKIVGLQ